MTSAGLATDMSKFTDLRRWGWFYFLSKKEPKIRNLSKAYPNGVRDLKEVVVGKVPQRAGIDPFLVPVDRNRDDNLVAVRRGARRLIIDSTDLSANACPPFHEKSVPIHFSRELYHQISVFLFEGVLQKKETACLPEKIFFS